LYRQCFLGESNLYDEIFRVSSFLPEVANEGRPRFSDVVLKTGLGLKTIFEVLVLTKTVLVLTLDGHKDLKNCGLKTKMRKTCDVILMTILSDVI